jgi:VCBS repeat-containing protein
MLTRSYRRVTGPVVLLPLLAIALLAGLPVGARAADLTGDYEWKPLCIGGAGWEVGCWIHPTEQNLVYSRPDVGGAYRWEATAATWVQIVTGPGMPAGAPIGYPGVDAIAGAPSDPNVVYMLAGPAGSTDGHVYRSSDRGDTWTLPSALGVYVNANCKEANDDERLRGESLAVDPFDPNVVYCGTKRDGLWVSTDGGATWTQPPEVPYGTDYVGVTCMDVDLSTGQAYAAVDGSAVYTSADQGATWTSIGGSNNVQDMEIGPDGGVYIADGNIDRYLNGSWSTIKGGRPEWDTVAVDPNDANHVAAYGSFGHKGPDITWDGGANWSGTSRRTTSDITWQQAYFPESGNTWMSCGKIVWDPFVPDRLWYSEGFGCWRADNAGADRICHWVSVSQGIEDLCPETVVWPPGGHPLTGGMDLGVFSNHDPDAYTATRVTPSVFLNGWGMDYCLAQPSFVACIQQHSRNGDYSSYSTDGGTTWTGMSGPSANKGTPTGLAVSATNPDNMVAYDGSRNSVYVTTNRGGSWTSTNLGQPLVTSWGPGDGAIVADRADGGTFYVYNWANDADGGIWRSTDGGSSWQHVATSSYTPDEDNTVPPTCYQDLASTPTRAGHLWFCGGTIGSGQTFGLYRSTDYGATWTHVAGTDRGNAVACGKAADGASYPAVYYYGELNGVNGVWRSTDNAQNWDLICEGGPMGVYSDSMSASASPDVFGRVAFSLGGKGFAYGQPLGGNVAPVANDDAYSTPQDTVLNVGAPGVLANDTDANGDDLTAVKVSDPSHGSVTLNSDGSFEYVPDTGYSGQDTFNYKAYDGELYSNTATVTITVQDADPPAAPTNLTATPVSSSQIDLDWDDNTEPDLDSYNVYRGGQQIATGVTASQYSDTGLSPSTQYCYTVTAVDTSSNESGQSNQACATTQEGAGTMHVDSIVVTLVDGPGPLVAARADVVIVDQFGVPVENATVTGTFTGDINYTGSDDTDQDGRAVIQTGNKRGVTSVTFCVDSVTHATLIYEPGDNVETCDTN